MDDIEVTAAIESVFGDPTAVLAVRLTDVHGDQREFALDLDAANELAGHLIAAIRAAAS